MGFLLPALSPDPPDLLELLIKLPKNTPETPTRNMSRKSKIEKEEEHKNKNEPAVNTATAKSI